MTPEIQAMRLLWLPPADLCVYNSHNTHLKCRETRVVRPLLPAQTGSPQGHTSPWEWKLSVIRGQLLGSRKSLENDAGIGSTMVDELFKNDSNILQWTVWTMCSSLDSVQGTCSNEVGQGIWMYRTEKLQGKFWGRWKYSEIAGRPQKMEGIWRRYQK